ncbi:hypothetical protein [Sporosarcina sp. FSL K6-1508]|uniref:hypothetical protein n=1 Tax=Sporosarcina sp. FSL K6-1508 TaxID=2921553 RepID=UPI0030F8C3DB
MSEFDGNEQDLLIKHVIRQFMKDQLNERKEDRHENNNSFVFLENSTLNMLIIYLLMNGERRSFGEVSEDSQEKTLKKLEQVMADNKNDFEEMIALLREKF